MSVIKKANDLFKKNDYRAAYKLYKEAKNIYGYHIVEYQIKKCEKIIKEHAIKNIELDKNSSSDIILYRIIGNNILGVHGEKQNIENLKFILEKESDFPNTKKIFILNRIVDNKEKEEIIQNLKKFNYDFIDLEFNPEDLISKGYELESLPSFCFWFERKYKSEFTASKNSLLALKNRYLMNNNGARNLALLDGKEKAKWVMPWDGNCFLSDSQFKELQTSFNSNKHYKYVITPLERILENNIDKNSISTNAVEEPQVSFHYTAKEVFNENLMYGHQPKVELFKRLGYPGKWDEWTKLYPWKKLEYKCSDEHNNYIESSSVFRLASLNKKTTLDMSSRAQSRSTGIINFIHSVEKNHIAKNIIENKTRLHTTIVNHLKSSLDTRLFNELLKNKNQISTIDKEAIKSAIAKHSNIKNNKTKSNVSLLLFNFSLLSNDILEFNDLTEKVKEDNLQGIYRSIREREVNKLQDYITDLYISLLFNLQNKKTQNSLAIKIELVGVIYFYTSLISPKLNNDFISSTNEIIKSIKFIFKNIFHYNIDKDFARIGVNSNLNELLEFNKAISMMGKIKKLEMSETYLNMVKYFVAQYENLSAEQRSYLTNDIYNALKLSEDKDLIDFISENHFDLIQDLNLSPKQIDKLFSTNKSEEKYNINKFIFFDLHTEPSEALTYIKQSKKTSKELNYKPNILYCNLYAKKRFLSNVSYKHNLNEFLTGYGLPKIIDINLQSDNILNSIRFEKQKKIKNSSKISVIMSAYNASETVEYAISSLLVQTVDDIEILVCDDASDDDTLNKILELSKGKSQVRVFKSIKNQGTYNIRNNLIKKATGHYITFQDSDDYSLPNRLEKQVIELEKSDKIICFTQWVRIKKNGSFVFFHDDNVSRFCVVSAMLKKDTFKEIPSFRKSLVAADTEFYQTIINKYGRNKIHQIYAPYIFGLADECSLTNIKTLNAENSGFVAKRRREYSDIAARQRILGKEIVTDQDVEKVLIDNEIYRTDHGVLEFIDGEWK